MRSVISYTSNSSIHSHAGAMGVKKGHPEGAKVFGYAKVSGEWRITLTKHIWGYYGDSESLLYQKIDYDILHETKHTIIQNAGHLGGHAKYNQEINLIGYYDL
jgi:hypothetical protein